MTGRLFERIGIFAAVLLLAAGCSKEKTTQPKPLGLRLTPLADAEAECLALWFSGEIEAPLDLYERIHTDLHAIRSNNGLNAVLDSITFTPPWEPGVLLFDMGPYGAQELRNHASPLWDSLNALYHPVLDSSYGRAVFPERLNSERLVEAYSRVPQISDAGVGMPRGFTYGGWWPDQITLGRLDGDTLAYAFQRGYPHQFAVWPDSIVFRCFYTLTNNAWSAGRYDVDSTGSGETPPTWWSDFCTHVRRMNPYAKNWCQGDPGIVPVRIVDVPPVSIGLDSFGLKTISLSGDFLAIDVEYSGGCAEHSFLLFMSPSAFAESNPVQANLYLSHDAHGDNCDALITQTARFDISPIARQYERIYGGSADIRLNVYNFSRTESKQVLYHHR